MCSEPMLEERFTTAQPYTDVLARQRALFGALLEERRAGRPGREALLWGEHPPVFTLGLHANRANVLAAGDVPAVSIERGGDVTFHGPGQLVVYPIIDLERRGWGARAYVDAIQQAVMATCRAFGVDTRLDPDAPGVWLGGNGGDGPLRKVCALGVKCSRYVTMHGLALNVTTDLGWFARINPCGFTDRGVTSLALETGRPTLDLASDVWPVLRREMARAGILQS